jgi:hypothetical protein
MNREMSEKIIEKDKDRENFESTTI